MTEQQKSPSIVPLEDVQRDLEALRSDVARLTQEMANYVSKTGSKALRAAPTSSSKAPFASVRLWRSRSPWGSGLCAVRFCAAKPVFKRGNSPDLVTEAAHGQRPRFRSDYTRTALPYENYKPNRLPLLERGCADTVPPTTGPR